jgi:phosphoribosylformimino-5-aminoimidazole carboxamide ribotide isomerase
MTNLIIYPAIDLRGGKVVRLREGDPNQQKIFSDDSLQTAQQWRDQGAEWLHIVNLDGAFSQANENGSILDSVSALGISIQFGGGLRSLEDVEQALQRGVSRAVLGTAAVENPELIEAAVQRFGAERICIALDARDGRIATRGWQTATDLTPIDFGKTIAEMGVQHVLFTDVSRDGKLSGVNLEATVELARQTGLQVIASGGVSTLEDITALAESSLIAGVVIGLALYEGRFTLQQALDAVNLTSDQIEEQS